MTVALPMKRPLLTPGWSRNELTRKAKANPSLDLRFAENKSLVDATTGSNLVTFTRASSGTFVGSDGLIRTAVTNLLLQSEDFSTTWAGTALLAFGSGSTVNAIAAPNGTITADLLVENTASSTHNTSQTISFTAGNAYTFSVWVKAFGRNVRLTLPASAFTNATSATFNTTTGALNATANSPTSTSATAFFDGWWRFSITATATTTASASLSINLISSNNTVSYTGDGTSGIYLWGAQLEQSSTVGEYIPTTSTINSAPRFDHNPTTGESLGLLVEEQRTNSVLHSEGFNITNWSLGANITYSENTGDTTAPNGVNTADKLTANAATSVEYRVIQAQSTSAQVVLSVFAKAGTHSFLQFRTTNVSSGHVNFDLTTGALSATTATGSITAFTNGWYRCVAVFPAVSINNIQIQLVTSLSAVRGETWTAAGTESLYLWGAQLEAGAFPTSYIPTTTATVTRSADVCSISGSNFSAWYRQDEGTVFANWLSTGASGFNTIYNFNAGASNTNLIEVYRNNNETAVIGRIRDSSGSVDVISATVSAWVNTKHKTAHAVALNNAAFCVNGGTVGVDSVVNLPTPTGLSIGSDQALATNKMLSGTIRRLTYWPTRLPNSTLQAVTQ